MVKAGQHTDVIRLGPFEPDLQVMSICDQVVEVLQEVLALASRQAVDCLGECSCISSITVRIQKRKEGSIPTGKILFHPVIGFVLTTG